MFPTHAALLGPGVPSETALMRAPYWAHSLKGEEHTKHEARPGTRRAAKDKQRHIRLSYAGIASGALEQDGGRIRRKYHPSHEEMAPALRYKQRESVTRELKRIDPRLISKTSTRTRDHFHWAVPQKPSRTYADGFFQHPSAFELKQDPKLSPLFEEKASKRNFVRFSPIGRHPGVAFTNSQTAVYEWLVANGAWIESPSEKRWKAGSIKNRSQESIAAELGFHRDTVRTALRSLADSWTDKRGHKHHGLGIIKYIRKPGEWRKNGVAVPKGTQGAVWHQDENEYIGIANWAETDKDRYDRAMQELRTSRSEWARVMDAVYAQTRLEWIEKNGQQKTFHSECRTRMELHGVPQDLINLAIPPPPN